MRKLDLLFPALKIITLTLALVLTPLSLYSYYFYEDFEVSDMSEMAARGWWTNYRYGKTGYFRLDAYIDGDDEGGNGCWDSGGEDQSYTSHFISNGMFSVRGTPNYVRNTWSGVWAGNLIKLSNHQNRYDASATQPVGFQVIREYAMLDGVTSCKYGGGGGASERQQGDIVLWLVKDEANPPYEANNATPGAAYAQAIGFWEKGMAREPNYSAANSRGSFGYYVGSDFRLDLTDASRPAGANVDLTANTMGSPTGLRWLYNDERGGAANNNALGMRITHDGRVIRLFINPNPKSDAANAFPNEWLLMKELTVNWSQDLTIMLGHEVIRFDQERMDANFDDVLLRSVSSGAFFQKENFADKTRYAIKANFQETDAGIAEIRLPLKRKPETQAEMQAIKKLIAVQLLNKNGKNEALKILQAGGKSVLPGQIGMTIIPASKLSGPQISLRLSQKSDTKNQVIDKTSPYKKIIIDIDKRLEKVLDVENEVLHVLNEKYDSDKYTKTATTGPQLASPVVPYSLAGNALRLPQ